LALYFFHLRDGQDSLIDPDGREIADPGTIADLALKEARAIIGHDATRGVIKLDQSIEVLDEANALVHQLPFRNAVTIYG
jgi:hypothetical protein